LRISEGEEKVIDELNERIIATLDEETGIISVFVEMPEALVAAQLAEKSIILLTDYLTEYRIEKIKIDLEYAEDQKNDAKNRFEAAQDDLASFSDSNQGQLNAKAEIERQRLQSEYNLTFGIYNTMSQKYEETKLKLQEETPIFKTLEPVIVPLEEDKPKKLLVIIFFGFLGTLIPVAMIVLKMVNNYESKDSKAAVPNQE
jgi:LPS O-antigen subunit length determinant protein (WzzB/FepE family)